MEKLTWLGWQTSADDAAQPTGPITKKDGTKVISIEGSLRKG